MVKHARLIQQMKTQMNTLLILPIRLHQITCNSDLYLSNFFTQESDTFDNCILADEMMSLTLALKLNLPLVSFLLNWYEEKLISEARPFEFFSWTELAFCFSLLIVAASLLSILFLVVQSYFINLLSFLPLQTEHEQHRQPVYLCLCTPYSLYIQLVTWGILCINIFSLCSNTRNITPASCNRTTPLPLMQYNTIGLRHHWGRLLLISIISYTTL